MISYHDAIQGVLCCLQKIRRRRSPLRTVRPSCVVAQGLLFQSRANDALVKYIFCTQSWSAGTRNPWRTKIPHRDRLRLSQMSLVQRRCVVWWNDKFQISKPQQKCGVKKSNSWQLPRVYLLGERERETCFIGIPEDLGWDVISQRLQVLKMPHKHSWGTEFHFDGTMMDSLPEICRRMGVLSLRMKTRNRRKRTKHHSQSTTMCLFSVWHTRTFGPSNLKKCFFVSVGVSFDRVVEVQILLTFVNCKLLRCDF